MTFFEYFPNMENVWSFVLLLFLFYRNGNKRFDVHFQRIKPVFFLSKDGDDAACEEESGGKTVYFPPESALSPGK